ncbi:glycosyltransferase family 4 protein [Methanosphaerula palustris]|uniref:Glycosyl transferase group 1 n=1 Tax=Methanosphaerula palustris (strain ATCC BAA-1556 / DSM 19958 / E1-9c) TaxID=521011 RepID=B8GDX8_METPE|nr:glycosyltransferase family 1 protein [Methanosphaerula palustris]ACL17479.1 glycosyl transferase group 1 [Methanosphaerula palustris E1-9c]
MKALYDHQIFERQTFGGISRYFFELMNRYYQNNTVNIKLSLIYSDNHYLKGAPFSHHLSSHQVPSLPGERGRNLRRNLLFTANFHWSRRQIAKGDYDLFHPTYYDPYFLNYLKGRPYVLTVYDMIHELYPEMFGKDFTTVQKRIVAERAEAILAISESTRTDIIRLFDIDPALVKVVHLATSLGDVKPDTTLTLPQRYILFVGNRTVYKNFNFFITSISPLLKKDRFLHVICAGGGMFSEAEKNLLKELNISKQVLYYTFNDSMLSQLYARAELFIFPSLYEGFGIPILEAFSCGCPVAASNTSSLPEVGGDAARYFDPMSATSLVDIVEEIVYDKPLQESLRRRGYLRLKNFSWEKTAEETRKIYEMIV